MGLFSSIGNFFGDVLKPVTSVVGGILGLGETHSNNQAKEDIARQQIQFQQDYAKNRLQWQVEDAKKAGLHPMVAAGLSPTSFSPVSYQPDPLNFDFVKDLGQNLDYAATKAKTNEQQEEAYNFQKAAHEYQLDSLRLDNELKQLEIMSMLSRLTQTGPAAPNLNGGKNLVGGQNDSGSTDDSFSPGTNPLLSLARVGNTLMAHINPDVSDSITEDIVRNQLANMNAEFQAGRLTPEVARHLSNNEKRMLARGEAELLYTPPSTWRFVLTPKMRPKYSNGGKEVSGKLNFSKLSY